MRNEARISYVIWRVRAFRLLAITVVIVAAVSAALTGGHQLAEFRAAARSSVTPTPVVTVPFALAAPGPTDGAGEQSSATPSPLADTKPPIATPTPSAAPERAFTRLPFSAGYPGLSPDGRFVATWTAEASGSVLSVRDLAGRTAASRSFTWLATVQGWMPDSSGVVVLAGGSMDDEAWNVAGVDGTLTPLPIGHPSFTPMLISSADGRFVASNAAATARRPLGSSVQGFDRRTKKSWTIPNIGEAQMLGWDSAGQFLFHLPGAAALEAVAADGGRSARPLAPGLASLTLTGFPSPDDSALAVGTYDPVTQSRGATWLLRGGTWRRLDIDSMLGWNGPEWLIGRRGKDVIAVDAISGASRTIARDALPSWDLSFRFDVRPFPLMNGAITGDVLFWLTAEADGSGVLVAVDLASGRTRHVPWYNGSVLGVSRAGTAIVDANGSYLVEARALFR